MASSRLEKIGTIYSRTRGLLKTGAMKWEDRPLWYDIYEAFPPKYEPRFDRAAPNIKFKRIFYEEDKIRALFHKHNKHIGAINMFNDKYKTITQRFINHYKQLELQYEGKASQEELYQEAVSLLKKEREAKQEIAEDDENISLSEAFKQAQDKSNESPSLNIKISDIFKQ